MLLYTDQHLELETHNDVTDRSLRDYIHSNVIILTHLFSSHFDPKQYTVQGGIEDRKSTRLNSSHL